MTNPVAQRGGRLSKQEVEVLAEAANGSSNKTIARDLGIGVAAVKRHLQCVNAKLGVHQRAHAVGTALRSGQLSVYRIRAVRTEDALGTKVNGPTAMSVKEDPGVQAALLNVKAGAAELRQALRALEATDPRLSGVRSEIELSLCAQAVRQGRAQATSSGWPETR